MSMHVINRIFWLTFASIMFAAPMQVNAMDDADIADFTRMLQRATPSEAEDAFWKQIDIIRKESEKGNHVEALELINQLNSRLEQHPDMQSVLAIEAGSIQVALKNWQQAKQHFLRSLHIEERLSTKEIDRFENPLMWLAGVEIELKELDKAEAHYLRLLRMKQSTFGAINYRIIAQLWALSHLYLNQGKYEKAKAYVREELKIWATKPTFLGSPLGDEATALQNLGAVQAHQLEVKEAIQSHLQARKIMATEQILKSNPDDLGAGTLARAIMCEERLLALYQGVGNSTQVAHYGRTLTRLRALVTRPPINLSEPLWHQSLLPLPK